MEYFRYVILWGPPKDIMMLQQQVGRCARDGLAGEAILYVTPRSTSNKFIDHDMKEAVNSMKTKCIRKTLLHYFLLGDKKEDIPSGGDRCCSMCDAK